MTVGWGVPLTAAAAGYVLTTLQRTSNTKHCGYDFSFQLVEPGAIDTGH